MDSSRHSRRDMDSSRHSRKGESEFDSSSLLSLIEKAAENEGARKALHTRKKYELKLIRKYDKWRLTSKECWFLIDARWLNAWSNFVKGPDDADPPGLISNGELLDEDGNPLPGLRCKIDYRGVAPIAYYILVQLHGRDKTPTICRYTVDIYKPAVPEERLVNMKMTAVMEAKILVNKVRPKWMSWDIEFEEDEEDDGLGWCCGLTKEHIEAFIYWAIMCWANRGRKKSGREDINYRQYKPLHGVDDDPDVEVPLRDTSRHSRGSTGNNNSAHGNGNSLHGTSVHSTRSNGNSVHGNSAHGNSVHGNTGSSRHGNGNSVHGNTSTHGNGNGGNGNGGDGNEGSETVNALHSGNFPPVNVSGNGNGNGNGGRGRIELVGMEMSESEYESTDDEGFAVAPADVHHERGTWLHTFMRR